MVARSAPKQLRKVVAPPPLDTALLRETVKKVDKCMARLQELQYTVTGGTKKIAGVTLSPRSTRGYLRTSIRCKQESLRMKNVNSRRSPTGKLPSNAEEWRRMSLPAMLLGETMGEILEASQFARNIAEAVSSKTKKPALDDPKTPVTERRRNQRPTNPENSQLEERRKREKQVALQRIRSDSDTPSLQRAKSRINFKVSPTQTRSVTKRIANILLIECPQEIGHGLERLYYFPIHCFIHHHPLLGTRSSPRLLSHQSLQAIISKLELHTSF